ncbi:hypothetical protein ABZ756_07305 [Mammaliicoccus sciuri]|uniref:Uncharacterized protein n=2 Tax=Sporosarcina newyorkensis TaxID=759851 RepID=A0A1T4Y4A6_9BACL|nr:MULTISPECIES: hypothetical protein [Sporosarcina]EGQ27139.1 hypothetical protein HMPREF9372_0826 [Sporosarcina newyorkensis 2681]MBY0221682.1 hypothetical protein [Sporosarcina aquimarina]SKA96348.1 hypothetical protein SAMN04244570_1803 [Sporosarcina newyorkensis]
MQSQDIWFENLFEGHLAHGFNKERIGELDHEEFLYFDNDQVEESVNQMQ